MAHYTLHSSATGRRATSTIAMLPPALGGASDFVREGFVDAVEKRSLSLDLLLFDIHPDSIIDGSALQLLHEQLLPVTSHHTSTPLWLMGISIGAYLAIAYSDHYAEEVDGLCLLAPYPGSRLLWGEIEKCGGIASWNPGRIGEDDHERRVWRWLKQHDQQKVCLHLGLSSDDRFAHGQEVMATAVPCDRIDRIAGEHQWSVWSALWGRFLDKEFASLNSRTHCR